MRRNELALQPLFEKRSEIIKGLPHFWRIVFEQYSADHGPFLSSLDRTILASLVFFSVERHTIKPDGTGDPRDTRFTFEFEKNEFFEDTRVVKTFNYRKDGRHEGLQSTPVPIKWKSKMKDPTQGELQAAVGLYEAELTMKLEGKGGDIDAVSRESLWPYEELVEKLAKQEGKDEPSFFNWFGYRGVVAIADEDENEDENEDEADGSDPTASDYSDDGLLDVEIYRDGGNLTEMLADDLWPNALDYFSKLHPGICLAHTHRSAVAAQMRNEEEEEDSNGDAEDQSKDKPDTDRDDNEVGLESEDSEAPDLIQNFDYHTGGVKREREEDSKSDVNGTGSSFTKRPRRH